MRVAVAVNEPSLVAIVPERFEDARGTLVVESNGMEVVRFIPHLSAAEMDASECEVLLCGDMYDPELFEEVSNRGLTRYYAADLPARQAVEAALAYRLPLIRDYVGGAGCNTVVHECDGDCAAHGSGSCDDCDERG